MHLQTLAITINQSLIGHDRYYEVGFGAGTPQQDRVCEATNAPVGISSNRTVLRKQDGGALPRQVRICPALLDHKIKRFHVRNRWIFLFVGWPHLVLTTLPKILSGRSQGQVDFLHSRALYPLFSEKEKTIPLFLLSQVKKLAQHQNGISAICNSTMLLLH